MGGLALLGLFAVQFAIPGTEGRLVLSAAYALITYQTAFLKAHFPVEFMCATMSADKDKIDKVVRTIAEARAMGITVLAPDVNESEIDFAVITHSDASGPVVR